MLLINRKKEFINKGILKHNNKYGYSLVEYKNSITKVKIICPEHGVFEQIPSSHLIGNGCPRCVGKNKTTEDFIKQAKKIHGDKYDYSKTVYISPKEKVKIICQKHGVFEQTPNGHIIKNGGCQYCATEKFANKKTKEQFILKAKEVHNDKYDYSLVNYVNDRFKIQIICQKHGVFEQTPNGHLTGRGCRFCGGTTKLTNNSFIEQAKLIHCDKYDYSNSHYIDSSTNITINCKEHGDFIVTPNNHLTKKHGCVLCSGKELNTEIYIQKAKEIHSDKYDYSLVNYTGVKNKIQILCSKHGLFEQLANSHIYGKHGCPKCSFINTKPEQEIKDFLSINKINYVEKDRNIICPKELDIHIPEHNIAIEYNGLYWHREQEVGKNYHLNKTELCEKQGLRLIHIFEDEWMFKQEIVKSRLMNILGLTPNKIFARKCVIKELDSKTCNQFLNENHIQGRGKQKIRLGLYYNDELVSVMTFGHRPVLNSSEWELIRFCNKLNTSVIGGADKLLKYFIRNHNPKEIISYADRRWSQGQLYEKLGFEFSHNSPPNFYYIEKQKRLHRINFQKHKLGLSEDEYKEKTAEQVMTERGFSKIYDCGAKVYRILF